MTRRRDPAAPARNIDLQHYPPEVLEMLESATKCLNCGKPLTMKQRRTPSRIRGYCSAGCYFSYSPAMAYASKVYGAPIKEVVVNLLKETGNVSVTAQRLGICPWVIYRWFKKLGIEQKGGKVLSVK